MTRPSSSLLIKILCWFFLNLALVAGVLAVFSAFQPHMNLQAIIGQQGAKRLRTAAMLAGHDLAQTSRGNWSGVLARHAEIHQIDFALVLENGSSFLSKEMALPQEIITRTRDALQRKHPPRLFPPPGIPSAHPSPRPASTAGNGSGHLEAVPIDKAPPLPIEMDLKDPGLIIRTRHPTRYWTGIAVPLPPMTSFPPEPAMFIAVSDSMTGNGFFFDPVPWMTVAAAMILISVLLWIPMVRSITRPLARMTLATEAVAKGRFDVSLNEPRADEIGRLANAINHMTFRLSAFVNGQKRFLGDVAHELGSPIARIQFGLGALEQRIHGDHRMRVQEIIDDVSHMSGIVNELLAFSRANIGTNTVRLETIDLLPVVLAAVKREAAPVTDVIVTIPSGIRVNASCELLTRAIANLVRNAVKYAGDAGPIHISAEQKNTVTRIDVKDDGPGVPEEYLDQLFEPFFRPEPSRDRDSGGVGLGLAIVKTCIETCRGTVTARNLKPHGFVVSMTLPS